MGRILGFTAFCCCTILLPLAGALGAQDGFQLAAHSNPHLGGPQDWSNRHILYTRHGSAADFVKVSDDPRFLHSVWLHSGDERRQEAGQETFRPAATKSNLGALHNSDSAGGNHASNDNVRENIDWNDDSQEDTMWANPRQLLAPDPWIPIRIEPPPIHRKARPKVDWSYSLGPTAGMALGETPAIFTANYSSPNCASDFVVYTINAAPTVGGQANLIALENLYSTGSGGGYCAGTGPSLLFSYAIGSGGSPLSPVVSLDGTRIAWIENRTSGVTTASYLHVTVWSNGSSGSGGSAVGSVGVTNTLVNGACSGGAPCDLALEYTASTYPGCSTAYIAGDDHSDLYVDYSSNTAFIGANNGLLYHIKNMFSTTTNPSVDFCVPVNTAFELSSSSALSGPVYDRVNNEVYITDSEKIYAYTVNASAATPNFALAASYTFGNSGSNYTYPAAPGPLLDALNGYVYLFSTYDAAGMTSVTQLPANFTTASPGAVAVELGPKSTNANPILFYGAFDNNYYNYGPKSALSTLYSCGTDSTTKTEQDLFAISFNSTTGAMNTTPAMSYNKNVNPAGTAGICSPLTEFYDGTNDRLFVGMGQPGASTGSNVVTSWNINTQLTNTSGSGGAMPTYTSKATGYLGGTSGIAADNNDSGTAQAESVYFSTEQIGPAATVVTATTAYNVNGIYTDGTTFFTGGFDGVGYAYSENLLGSTVTWNGATFPLSANQADVWSNTTVTLPSGQYNTLTILGAAVNASTTGFSGTLLVNYTDSTSTTLTQSFSDWAYPLGFKNESVAKNMAYRDFYNGTEENPFPVDVFGYSFAINPNKTVTSVTLPTARNVCVIAIALSTNCGGADFCAVKLTQSGLQ